MKSAKVNITISPWDSVSASISSPVAASVTEKLAQLSNSTDAAEQKAYVDALTAVAPEVAPMVQKTQTETANQVFGAVGTRLTGGSISTGGEGMASGDSIFKRGAMWVQGLFNKSKLDDTSKAMLTLEKAKERILNLLTENMRNFKNDSWDIKNRMNKLITDTENNSIFSLRLGGKRIARYSLDLLTTEQKINFLADFYTSVVEKEFDDDILNFLAQEVDNAAVRKKEANERRRLKKKEAKEQKVRENIIKQADATTRTVAAAEPLLQEIGIPNASLLTQI